MLKTRRVAWKNGRIWIDAECQRQASVNERLVRQIRRQPNLGTCRPPGRQVIRGKAEDEKSAPPIFRNPSPGAYLHAISIRFYSLRRRYPALGALLQSSLHLILLGRPSSLWQTLAYREYMDFQVAARQLD